MNVEAEGIALQGSPVNIRDSADAVAHDAGRVVEGFGLRKSSPGIEIVAQQSDHRLADGEAAAGQNYKYPLSRLNETKHFAAGVDLVKTRISPRIGGQHQPFPRRNSQTI